jgi:large subunit ribosomal protein L14e
MPFHRYMEVGRVVLINYGPEKGKLAAVIDIVDQNKCLIDGPCSGVTRQVIALTRVALTDFTIKIQRSARQKTITKAWTEGEVDSKWAATSWAKKLNARKTRANLSDFDRFKVMVAKKQKTEIINKKLATM